SVGSHGSARFIHGPAIEVGRLGGCGTQTGCRRPPREPGPHPGTPPGRGRSAGEGPTATGVDSKTLTPARQPGPQHACISSTLTPPPAGCDRVATTLLEPRIRLPRCWCRGEARRYVDTLRFSSVSR